MSKEQYGSSIKTDSNNTSTRSDFINSWLFEMPIRKNQGNIHPTISYNIKDIISTGVKPKIISNNLYKIELTNTIYYWYGSFDNVILGVELSKKPQSLVVNMISKDPTYTGKFPYASDLYDAILKDNNYSLCITSDEYLSDEGFGIWQRLFNKGHVISVYNTTDTPGQSRTTFKSQDEMNQYFGDNESFKNYRFVISESVPEKMSETRAFFNTRRMRELADIL